jgi:hypothetical protein
MDYKAIAQQTVQEILGYNQDTSGWKLVKTAVRKQIKCFNYFLIRVHCRDFLFFWQY